MALPRAGPYIDRTWWMSQGRQSGQKGLDGGCYLEKQNSLILGEFSEPLGTSPSLHGTICDHLSHWGLTVKD